MPRPTQAANICHAFPVTQQRVSNHPTTPLQSPPTPLQSLERCCRQSKCAQETIPTQSVRWRQHRERKQHFLLLCLGVSTIDTSLVLVKLCNFTSSLTTFCCGYRILPAATAPSFQRRAVNENDVRNCQALCNGALARDHCHLSNWSYVYL